MADCLLSLGSNVGDREAMLRGALGAIAAIPGVGLLRHSRLYRTRPIGGPAGQSEFLNAATVVATERDPLALLEELQRIETQFGRERSERWAARTVDIDLLLVGRAVIRSEQLVVPHPRMSYRPFVLEPSAEIAGDMIHPTIGWSIQQLWEHLNLAGNRLVILSTDSVLRNETANFLTAKCNAAIVPPPTAASLAKRWPSARATWLELPAAQSPQNSASGVAHGDLPKLTVQFEQDARLQGRGPTLLLDPANRAAIEDELLAAVEALWPDLCRR